MPSFPWPYSPTHSLPSLHSAPSSFLSGRGLGWGFEEQFSEMRTEVPFSGTHTKIYLNICISWSSTPLHQSVRTLSNLSRWEKLTWLTLYFFMSSIYVINFVSWILWGSDFWYYSIQKFLLSTLSSILGAVLSLKSWALTPFFPLCISFEVTVPW